MIQPATSNTPYMNIQTDQATAEDFSLKQSDQIVNFGIDPEIATNNSISTGEKK